MKGLLNGFFWMGVHWMGVHWMGVHWMGVHWMGVHRMIVHWSLDMGDWVGGPLNGIHWVGFRWGPVGLGLQQICKYVSIVLHAIHSSLRQGKKVKTFFIVLIDKKCIHIKKE